MFTRTNLALALLAPAAWAQDRAHTHLDDLVAAAQRDGRLASVAVAVVRGDELVYDHAVGQADLATDRPATPETLYRIASLTKPLTATLLVALRDAGTVRLDDPVIDHLPSGFSLPTDPRGALAITLRHLVQHTSGLPERPIDVPRGDAYHWGDYDAKRLRASLARTKLISPIESQVLYSNLGVGLLGFALAHAAGEPYRSLLDRVVLQPVGMRNTVVATAAELGDRLATGYDADGRMVEQWELGCLEACGSAASTTVDMATFLSLQLRAGGANDKPLRGGTLAELQRPQRVLDGWRGAVGLGWFIDETDDLGEVVRHNGGMAGYQTHMSFTPVGQMGVVVLANTSPTEQHVAKTLGAELLRAALVEFGRPPASVARLVHDLAAHFRPEPPAELADLFAPGFLERLPMTTIRPEFARPARAHGAGPQVAAMRLRSSPWHVRATLEFADGHRLACTLRVTRYAPHRITYITLQ
ncbi:MAG: serine hydrolase domain-containing protein [Planctomycetota bacterium]